jgi:lactoylglutathione lyase
MHIHHIAIWTKDIERLKSFYEKYFKFSSSDIYNNTKTGFQSYFLTDDDGVKIEIMQKEGIPDNKNNVMNQNIGIIHLALSIESKDELDLLTNKLRDDGFIVVSEPRTTGDGYYESCILDPDENRIEIVFK